MFHSITEDDNLWTRRHWLKAAGALTVGATCAHSLQALAQPDNPPALPMQIGILMGTFARPTLEARLDAVKACGLDCVQLSMSGAGLPAMPDEIPPELVARICRAADARGITIASLEGTFNMSHPDAEHRRAGLRRLRVLAAVCRPLGTSKIHLCTGTRDTRSITRTTGRLKHGETWCLASAKRLTSPGKRT